MRIASMLSIVVIMFFSSCDNQAPAEEEQFDFQEIKSNNEEIKEVIYSMYLPTDMAEIFNRSGTNYNPKLPAAINDLSLYDDPEQIAILLGIYGVDLMYMKLLGQSIEASNYYNAIEQLSGKIGIPKNIFEESSGQMEKYFTNEDTLAVVIENIYRKTDAYFKESGQQDLAALAFTGGWIEAMYIGVSIFEADSGNLVMAERILQQKYSLNSIYSLLSNHQESLSITGYLLLLKRLRKVFENVQIYYQKQGFSVDTTQKRLKAYSANINYSEETMNELKKIIPLIREEFIYPNDQKK
jgi:hypothetical protein